MDKPHNPPYFLSNQGIDSHSMVTNTKPIVGRLWVLTHTRARSPSPSNRVYWTQPPGCLALLSMSLKSDGCRRKLRALFTCFSQQPPTTVVWSWGEETVVGPCWKLLLLFVRCSCSRAIQLAARLNKQPENRTCASAGHYTKIWLHPKESNCHNSVYVRKQRDRLTRTSGTIPSTLTQLYLIISMKEPF